MFVYDTLYWRNFLISGSRYYVRTRYVLRIKESLPFYKWQHRIWYVEVWEMKRYFYPSAGGIKKKALHLRRTICIIIPVCYLKKCCYPRATTVTSHWDTVYPQSASLLLPAKYNAQWLCFAFVRCWSVHARFATTHHNATNGVISPFERCSSANNNVINGDISRFCICPRTRLPRPAITND